MDERHPTLTVLDFVTNLDGASPRDRTDESRWRNGVARSRCRLTKGKSSYEFFGGSTVPWFAGSRQLAGLNVTRQINSREYVDATTAVVSAPALVGGTVVARQLNVFQTVGLTERLNDRAAVQVRGGGGTSGLHGQAASSCKANASRPSPR